MFTFAQLFVCICFFFPFSYFCNSVWPLYWLYISETRQCLVSRSGADPGFFLGGGALVFCSTSTPINHIVFFSSQNTSCIRKLQVISGEGGGAHPLHPPPRSAPVVSFYFSERGGMSRYCCVTAYVFSSCTRRFPDDSVRQIRNTESGLYCWFSHDVTLCSGTKKPVN